VAACVGGLIAKWRLDNTLTLVLTLNYPVVGTKPNEYILAPRHCRCHSDRVVEPACPVRAAW